MNFARISCLVAVLAASQGAVFAQSSGGGTGPSARQYDPEELLGLAEAGHAWAQFRIGLAAEKRTGIWGQAHLVEAMHWYRLAAEQGHSEAQNRLGDLYYDGTWTGSIPQDLDASQRWHLKAARQGNVKSQYKLGSLLCWLGKSVEGYTWLTVSERSGLSGARKERRRVCKELPAGDVEAAETAAEALLGEIEAARSSSAGPETGGGGAG